MLEDGFYTEEDRPTSQVVVNGKQRVLKKIPESVIKNAVGLAVFTTMRTGLWVSGAGGSGILVARKADGTWSPPSGILLHTAGLGFLVGVDVYDCVCVINTRKALESFTKTRATLGGEVSAVAGPVGVGGVLENDGKWKQANRPVFTYLKSRGFYAGVQVDGTVIVERTDENERFYGERIGVADILAGKARHPPYEIKMLMETLKAAEGSTNVDKDMMEELADQPAPGDVEVSSPTTDMVPLFGVPEADDPDPFGVHALENAGLEIKEAGTKSRPPSTQFEFHPSPTSPIYGKFHRHKRSVDTTGSHSNRESFMSHRTRASIDRGTQTELGIVPPIGELTPGTSPSHSDEHNRIVEEDSKPPVMEPEEIDYTKIDLGPYNHFNISQDFDGTTMNDSPRLQSNGFDKERSPSYVSDSNDAEDEEEEEEPVVFEAASAQATILTPHAIKARGGVVTIPARGPPPPLPPRSMKRRRSDLADGMSPISPTSSMFPANPLRDGFQEVDLHGVDVSARTSVDNVEKRESFAQTRSGLGIEEEGEEVANLGSATVNGDEPKAEKPAATEMQRLESDLGAVRLASIASVDSEGEKAVLEGMRENGIEHVVSKEPESDAVDGEKEVEKLPEEETQIHIAPGTFPVEA